MTDFLSCKKRLKNSFSRFILLAGLALFLVRCGTSTKSQDLLIVTSAGAAGAVLGAASSPEYDKPEGHALLWGSLAGLAAALYIDLRSNQIESDLKASILKNQLELERKMKAPSRRLLSEGLVKKDGLLFGQTIPAGTRYQHYESSSLQTAESPLRVLEISRELEFTFPEAR